MVLSQIENLRVIWATAFMGREEIRCWCDIDVYAGAVTFKSGNRDQKFSHAIEYCPIGQDIPVFKP